MDVEDAMNARGLTKQNCLDPVSYTHLDVYKRQFIHYGLSFYKDVDNVPV